MYTIRNGRSQKNNEFVGVLHVCVAVQFCVCPFGCITDGNKKVPLGFLRANLRNICYYNKNLRRVFLKYPPLTLRIAITYC